MSQIWFYFYSPRSWMDSHELLKKLNFMVSTRLQSCCEETVYFLPLSPQSSGTHLINLRMIKGWVDLEAAQWFWTYDLWIRNPGP